MISNVGCFVTGLLKIIHCKQHCIESSWFNEQIQSFKQRLKLCITQSSRQELYFHLKQ